MSGDLGNLQRHLSFKNKYGFPFALLMMPMGLAPWVRPELVTSEHHQVMENVDVYFGTFAKAMAGIGAFVASEKRINKIPDL